MDVMIIGLFATAVVLFVLWWWRRHAAPEPIDPEPEPVAATPLKFSGGYATFQPVGVYNYPLKTKFSCAFKTLANVGVIMAVTIGQSTIKIRLTSGNVVTEVFTNTGPDGSFSNKYFVNDDRWHTVVFKKNRTNDVTVKIDNTRTIAGKLRGNFTHDTKPTIYLGGAPQDVAFIGCIKYVNFNGKLIPDSDLTLVGLAELGCV